MSNIKRVMYEGLEIIGDANKIDELIYNKKDHKVEVLQDDFIGAIEKIYEFNDRVISDIHSVPETVDWLKQFILCIMDELSELLGELSWKHWKDYSDYEFNKENVKGEIADILIFTFGMAGIVGISPEEMVGEIIRKNKVNLDRQERGY